MTIQRLQITANREEYALKALYAPKSKERDKRAVREDVAELLETVAAGVRAGRKPETDGGQAGFWERGRVEEIVVERGETCEVATKEARKPQEKTNGA